MRRLTLGLVALLATVLGAPALPTPSAVADELPVLTQVSAPSVDGTRRFGSELVADPGSWSPTPTATRYQWFRGDRAITGATTARHEIRPNDVGHQLAVRVTVSAPGHATTTVLTRTAVIRHRVDARRTVRYAVRVKGSVGAATVRQFRALAQETFEDARGWRGRGVVFVPVRSGGAFTLWISQAGHLPRFSSACSAQWSCRVGRNVVINVERWKHASPAWNRARGSLRNYRHMVVNHETGHWLGRGHVGCGRRGALAPVMMQQSKGLNGCRFNPWPTLSELRR
ncbi:hypothetical protein ASE01_09810 [Nocardioides sp. Root190]|uniref:DUF3152 domain-containing protein n=1 Tax=Nocardioides sp. Root190 TaxID=1736488 RepID=UPI0006F5CA30|nr:DUF3152 domain-containing protein [Nocardioides sp. Root190]KRB77048.1 hypothetical protein ASE01_09810 [Nocardioides sp. Root190]